MFWTDIIPQGQGSGSVDVAAGTASMQLNGFELLNGWTVAESNFGGGREAVPATVDVNATWDQPQTPFELTDADLGFAGTFVHNVARLSWSAQWGEDTFVAEPFSDGFAVVGQMRNGRLFDGRTAVEASSWGQVKRRQLYEMK